MFEYIDLQPKGTFTNEQLQSFVNMGWLTQDQYNQLSVTDNTSAQNSGTNVQQSSAPQSANPTAQSNATNA